MIRKRIDRNQAPRIPANMINDIIYGAVITVQIHYHNQAVKVNRFS